jgi:hypothetical protein
MSTQKSSPKHLSKVTRGFEELTTPVDSEKVNENRVCADWEIITKTPFEGDIWI